jgi:predicted acyl esterase
LALLLLLWVGPLRAQYFPLTSSVKMPDGIELATDVWRNFFDDTPRPVMLRRTPYGRAGNASDVANLTNAGFIVVSQDVRGRGNSGGTFLPFFTDKEDARATIDWIAAQPWSNGRVGTYSASAEGIVQYMAMAAAPAALACTHIMMATPNLYEAIFPGGAWRTDLGTAWLKALNATDVIDIWKANEARTNFWDAATLSRAEMAKVDHPVFVLGGFFDIFANDTSKAAHDLQTNVSPSSRADVFVVLGPWTHGSFASSRQGELLYPDDASMPSANGDFLQYLNWCLQGAARPPFANVRYYLTELTDETKLDPADNKMRLVVRGEWSESTLWPPAEVRTSTLYLGGERDLLGPGGGAPAVALKLDPADPTPSLGGGNFVSAAGPYHQGPVDTRDDVFVSTSAPFVEETRLVGNPRALIWASSTTDDIDVVVRLEVVTPAGRAVAFTDGIRRGRFVAGYDLIRPLTPGVPTLFEVELGPIALRLPVGHAVRVAISAASSPRYELNPNTIAPLASEPKPIATTLSIYRDEAYPSRIELPLLRGSVPGGVVSALPPTTPLDAGVPASDAGATPSRPGTAVPSPGLDAAVEADAGTETPASDGCVLRAQRAGTGSSRTILGWGLLMLWLSRRRSARPSRATRSPQMQ